MLSPRPTSERQAAAARVNGAKSRGPRTAAGKSASSRNSFRHGLRAQTLFSDQNSQREIAADYHLQLDCYRRELRPQSETEEALVQGLVLAHCLRDRIHRLETSIVEQEIHRLANLNPGHSPAVLTALAFQSLCDNSCVLQLLNRFGARFARRFDQALRLLTELRSAPKRNVNERTQQVIENTSAAFHSIWNGFPETTNIDERTQEIGGATVINERTQHALLDGHAATSRIDRGHEAISFPAISCSVPPPFVHPATLPPNASYNPTKGLM